MGALAAAPATALPVIARAGAGAISVAAVVLLPAFPIASASVGRGDSSDGAGDDAEHRDGGGCVVTAPIGRSGGDAHCGQRKRCRRCECKCTFGPGKHFALL